MKKVFGFLLITAVVFLSSEASAYRRHHVYIHKAPPHASMQPIVRPLVAVPPFAVAIDLIRRTSCDPAIAVASGPDDPGFTSHPVGNYLIPAIYRSQCQAAPK